MSPLSHDASGGTITSEPTSMTRNDAVEVPRFRLILLLWLAGMAGAAILTSTALPQMLRAVTLPAPLWVISLASLAQSALLIALACWGGKVLGSRVNLRAPMFEAAAMGRALAPALRPQLLPGLIVGVLGGVVLLAIGRYAPDALLQVQKQFDVPLLARVLYGGITEELLLRWGIMTTFVWLMWRFLQRQHGIPRPIYVWLAIIASALLFGAGHLPAAQALIGELTSVVVVFVIGANAAFGVLFGYLFWRYGLEAAMIAHATAHVVNYAVEPVLR